MPLSRNEGTHVRIAGPQDAEALYGLVMESAANGHTTGPVSAEAVRSAIDEALGPGTTVVALAERDGRPEGMVALRAAKLWYGAEDGYYWTELGLFVRDGARASRHGVALLRFVQWWATATGLPVYFSLAPREDFARKERLFGRFAERVGSLYRFDPKKELA